MDYKFELSKEQIEKFEKWQESLPKLPQEHFGAVGGGYSFEFCPTAIGTVVKAKRADGQEKDLTEWKYF